MANRRKRLRDWQWTHSIMWWAFIISGIIHLCFVYFVPTIDILPADPGYIEVDESWLATIPDDEVSDELHDTPTDEGLEPASTPGASTAWDFPSRVDALEPLPATKRNTDNAWETAFVGLQPALSESLERPDVERTVPLQAVEADIPSRTVKDALAQNSPKTMPISEMLEMPALEPDVDIETDVETQAEQRFQEDFLSASQQQISQNFDPEPLAAPVRELLEAEHEELLTAVLTPRQASVQPLEFESVSAVPSPTSAKSLPAVNAPKISERLELNDEEALAAAKPILDFPEPATASAPPDASNELPEVEARAPELLVSRKASLPELFQHDRKIERTAFLRQDADNIHSTLPSRGAHKAPIPSSAESTDKRELIVDDAEIQAHTPVFSQPTPQQAAEHVEQPSDAPRPSMPKALIARERVEEMPMKRSSGIKGSLTKRSLILGDSDDVPTLPLEGPRFGILVKKEESVSEEDVMLNIEPKPEESLQQAEQQPELPADEFVIEGPAAGRQVLFKPRQFPDVELDIEVTIRLKFWVLPDGTVAEVIPLQRGDVRLERAAIAYMKSWRFTAVSPEQPQVWGIIPIRYTLR